LNANSVVSTSFTGSGANLTNLNASNITTGTISNDKIENAFVTVNGVRANLGNVSATVAANTPNPVIFTDSTIANSTGATFNGSNQVVVNYATVGAPKSDGVGVTANSTWNINITGNSTFSSSANTVVTPSQPNITSVGTLTSLSVFSSSNIVFGGNLTIPGSAPNLFLRDIPISQILSNDNSDNPSYEMGRSRGTFAAPQAIQVSDTTLNSQFYGYTGGGDAWYENGYAFSAAITTEVLQVPTGNNSIPTKLIFAAGTGNPTVGLSAAALNGNTGRFEIPALELTDTNVNTATVAQAHWVPIVINGVTYKLLLGA
jgi:hypothetical protein